MQDASFVAMLKAFLTQKEGDASKFDELLADAVELCNINVIPERATRSKTATCRNIKQMLAKYCEEGSEAERSAHLVEALNTILKWKFVEPSVIFVHNDPVIVGCPTNPDYMKAKPDIILVSVSAVAKWFGEKAFTFDECCKAFSDGTPFDRNGASWSDVCQSWELEKDTLASADALTKTYAIPEPESSSPSTTGEKRKAGDTPGGHRKRPRWDPPFILDGCNTSELPRPPPDLQCETYAAECFRSSWDITHTTVVYLSGSQLALSRYDPQGEITSNAIDIIEELPLFIVFISILGLCDGLSGVGKAKKTVETHGEIGEIRHFTAHLSGRRTFGADFARKAVGGTLPARVQNRPLHFLKVSWTAERAGYEPDIIELALDRADTLLPSNCRNYVKDHLPWIVEHGDIEGTSTSIIRKLLGLDEKGSRVQRWIISEKLSPLKVTATTPKDFYRAYWEIIRCHYLLWIIGIAHGDISFSNCMFNTSTKKGILNDFDISLVMDPGADSPPSSGQENMGTLPFMALDLLTENGYSGNVAHRYRHELESFMWVLAWAAGCVSVNPVQEKIVAPFDGWVGVDHKTVRMEKNDFLYDWKVPSESWLPIAALECVERFMAGWQIFYTNRSSSMRLKQIWTEPDGRELLEKMVEAAAAMPEEIKDDWLKEEVKLHVAEVWPEWQKQHKKT